MASNAVFSSQTDFVQPGQPVCVTMQNTGTSLWDAGYCLAEEHDAYRVAVSGTVAPGASYTFEVPITGTPIPGTLQYMLPTLQMLRVGVGRFGQSFIRDVVVLPTLRPLPASLMGGSPRPSPDTVGFWLFKSGAYNPLICTRVRKGTWQNPSGQSLAVKSIEMWVGVSKDVAKADLSFEVIRSDGSSLAQTWQDRYCFPGGDGIRTDDFDPPAVLLPGESFSFEMDARPFDVSDPRVNFLAFAECVV